MLLDLSFYCLGFSSPQHVVGIFNGCSTSQTNPSINQFNLSTQFICVTEPIEPTKSSDIRDRFQDDETDCIVIVFIWAVLAQD